MSSRPVSPTRSRARWRASERACRRTRARSPCDLKATRKADLCRYDHDTALQACGARAQLDAQRQADDALAHRARSACAMWCDFALPRMEVCSGEARGALAGARAGCISKSLAGDPIGLACTQLLAQERILACPEFLRSHGLCVDNTDCHRGESFGDEHRCVPE